MCNRIDSQDGPRHWPREWALHGVWWLSWGCAQAGVLLIIQASHGGGISRCVPFVTWRLNCPIITHGSSQPSLDRGRCHPLPHRAGSIAPCDHCRSWGGGHTRLGMLEVKLPQGVKKVQDVLMMHESCLCESSVLLHFL